MLKTVNNFKGDTNGKQKVVKKDGKGVSKRKAAIDLLRRASVGIQPKSEWTSMMANLYSLSAPNILITMLHMLLGVCGSKRECVVNDSA